VAGGRQNPFDNKKKLRGGRFSGVLYVIPAKEKVMEKV
jgi:hypothetical protein